MESQRNLMSLLVSACLLVTFGCGTPSQPTTTQGAGESGSPRYSLLTFDESPEDMWQRIARDAHHDWSTGFVHSYRVDAIRQELRAQPAAYKVQQVAPELGDNLQFIGFFTEPETCGDLHDHGNGKGKGNSREKVGNGYGLCKNEPQRNSGYKLLQSFEGLSAPLTGRPTSDANGHLWWLREDGVLYRHDSGSGTGPYVDFVIRDMLGNIAFDSFKNSELTLYATGAGGPQVGFVCSDYGFLYVIDMTVGSSNYGRTTLRHNLGSVEPLVGHVPPVFFDNASGTSAPIQAYVLTNTGGVGANQVKVHRFLIHRTTGPTGTLASYMATELAAALPDPYTEFSKTAPIVFKSQLSFGTWRRHNTFSPGADRGGVYHYNLAPWITSGGSTPPTQVANAWLNRPVNTPPSIDLDWNGNTKYVFQPSGNYLNFLNLVTGRLNVGDKALVLNPGDPDTGNLNALNFGWNNEQPARVDLDGGIQGQTNILYPLGGASAYSVAVLNGNGLWKVSLRAPTDGMFNPDFSLAGSQARDDAFMVTDNWTFTKTESGRTWGTVDAAGKYVTNPCFPTQLFAGNRWMLAFMDNWGGPSDSTHTVAQMFNLKTDGALTPPALSGGGFGPASTGDLHAMPLPPGGDVASELAGEFMTYDWRTQTSNSVELLFNTRSNTSNPTQSAGLWRWVAPLDP